MSANSIFNRLLGDDRLIEVEMDDVQILLPSSALYAIGTQNLNGCTSVVILGEAIIMAHIPPGVLSKSGVLLESAKQATERSLAKIDSLLAKHGGKFPLHTTTWGIFARTKKGSMEEVEAKVKDHLGKIGLSMRPEYYDVTKPSDRFPPAGEIVAFVRNSGTELWLEDRKLETKPRPVIAATSTTPASQRSAPQPQHSISSTQATSAQAMFTGLTQRGYSNEQAFQHLVSECIRKNPAWEREQAVVAGAPTIPAVVNLTGLALRSKRVYIKYL